MIRKLSGPSIAISLVALAAGLHGLNVSGGTAGVTTVAPAVVRVAMASADAVPVQVCVWPGINGCGGTIPVEIVNGQRAQLYAAVLYSDGTVECNTGTTDTTALFNAIAVPFACDSAEALLDFSLVQDTVPRWVRFFWANDTTVADYQIQVLTLADSVVLDTIVPGSPLEWMDGELGQDYTVRGRTRVIVSGAPMEGSFSTPKVFAYPGLVQIPAMPAIEVDTVLFGGGVGAVGVSDIVAASGKAYLSIPDLALGDSVYIDRIYSYAVVPSFLIGSTYIRTAWQDESSNLGLLDFLSFTIDRAATVYVGHRVEVEPDPTWLASEGFVDTGLSITTNGTLTLFSRDYDAGLVTLGANSDVATNGMYAVILVPR